jgi:hypothetical protein
MGPLAVALLAIALASVFVLCRWSFAADGDVSRFVVAGKAFADPATIDPPIHVFDSSGYDGQFYWRMAVAPDAHDLSPAHGMRIDQGIRFGRIGYPTVAWLGALGADQRVPWALVGVNVLGIGAIAGCVASYCRRRGLDPLYGLLVAGSSGLVMALSRDLTEVLMIAGLVAGIVALDRGRVALTAAAWAFAVVVHEQALLVVGAYAVARIIDLARRRRRPERADAAWIVPAIAFAGWQLICLARWDELPVSASGSKNLGLPFAGLIGLASDWLSGDIARQEVLFPLQLLFVMALTVVALRTRLSASEAWLKAAVAAGALLAVLISYNVWKQPAELRQIAILPALAWITVLSTPTPPPRWLTTLGIVATCATAALRIVAI